MKYILLIVCAALFFTSCEKAGDAAATGNSNTAGKGGSLARFTIVGDYLYAVDNVMLHVYDIHDPATTSIVNSVPLGFGVETIYPYKDKLFIGSRDGMYIYSITTPSSPVLLGEAKHTRSCDPVVANDSVAFVSLMGNQPCGPAEDGIYTYNIKNILTPVQIHLNKIPTPNGIGLQDSILYVCQKTNGMSIYNVKNPAAPVLRNKITGKTFEDVICYDNILVCYISTGLALYDVSVPSAPVELSLVNN
ncbi:LVIVD repeat-containing protein [Ferruginibacter sp. HRS2-29]|uniref:LVIVD repeat-containing protein n=1 Tax=Ferruginibacter sp. HRS2-29 TaxID=2487334 RepID=UPI0020CE0389|nr:hypothetical protein [Ferruginibacter sp. HRS2-29]MCP9749624.1 hypothetical protein [Ferruginibacter sp. HRS2-29]